MPMPKEQYYTYADLLSWGEDTRYELYNGQPIALASPSQIHQEISMELSTQLHSYLRGKKCKVYTAPFDVRLFEKAGESPENVDTVVQPDIMVVCDPSKVDRHGVHGAPDLIIEILSDSTRRIDRLTKFNLYQRAGVREYWIADPSAQVVLVHTLEDGSYHSPVAYNGMASVPVGILGDYSIDLTTVFTEG